jgi:hypothetical protein
LTATSGTIERIHNWVIGACEQILELTRRYAQNRRSALFFQVMDVSAKTSTRHRASVNNTYAADSAERIDDPDGLLVREA